MPTDLTLVRRAAENTAVETPALGWLQAARSQALAQFSARGLPTTAEEDWRYTDLSPAADRLTAQAASTRVSLESFRARLPVEPVHGVLLDGVVRPELALAVKTPGLAIRTLGEVAPREQEALASRVAAGPVTAVHSSMPALNAALLRDALVIEIAPRTVVEHPLYVFIGTSAGASAQNRVLLKLGAGARATLIEHHAGGGGAVSNSVTDVVCENGSRLNYVNLQAEPDDCTHVATQRFHLASEAIADLLHLDLGSLLARNDLHVELAGARAEVTAHGLFFADGRRHLDNHTRIDHRATDTRSRELYRGIAEGKGRGVFNGKVIVHSGTAGTDAQLRNQNLLLSAGAEIDTKPELEIYADDVKCSHGATTGQLDQAAIFYLRSRGIELHDARRMLIAAFAREIVGRLPAGPMSGQVLDLLRERLPDIGEIA